MDTDALKVQIEKDTRSILQNMRSLAQIQKLKFYGIVHEMLSHDTSRSKREIFYMAVPVFKSQSVVDKLVKATSTKFGVCLDPYITASLKGLYSGPIRFHSSEGVIQNSKLIPDMQKVFRVECDATSVVVIEKDALFSFIVERTARSDILFVCGKGYPCRNTIKLLQMIKIKKYGIFDFDPFGLHIFSVYRKSMSEEDQPTFLRLGITSQDLFDFKVSENDLISLNSRDLTYIENMIKRKDCESLNADLMFLKGLGKKLEMEAFINNEPDFFERFLDLKIARGNSLVSKMQAVSLRDNG